MQIDSVAKTPHQTFSVLLISDSYPPVMGGSEIEAQRVASALIQRGHSVKVLCGGGPPMPPVRNWTDQVGVPVFILTRNSTGRWKHIVFAIQVGWAMWRERHHYDAVYFLMQGLQLVTGLPVARLLGKPIIMKFSGSGIIPVMKKSFTGRLEMRCLARWAYRLLVLNDGMVEEAVKANLPSHKLAWMPNPVDTGEFRPAEAGEVEAWRGLHGIPCEACVVIYVGRLSQEKGLIGLMRGFTQALRDFPEAMLVLVGDGPQRAGLEALARELQLGPDRLHFAGRVDVKEVPCWLRASNIFALTSPNEGFSCALAEAMSAGLASVVSDIPANRQLVEPGVHGLTTPFDNEAKIGHALLRLFREPELRRRMGQAARQRVADNYSTAHIIARYEALLEEMTAPPQHG